MMMQGLVLTAIGMGTVFLFLCIMILLMSNLKTLVDLMAKISPEPGEAGRKAPERREAAELPMVAAAVLIAARYGR